MSKFRRMPFLCRMLPCPLVSASSLGLVVPWHSHGEGPQYRRAGSFLREQAVLLAVQKEAT
jgi:hypothetical protein